MISLVFDTNIWISYVAKNWPTGIISKIKEKRDAGEIILLTNEIIIEEWERNKETTLKDVQKKADEVFSYTKKAFEKIDEGDKKIHETKIEDFLNQKCNFAEISKQQVEETEKMIYECTITPITDKMKIRSAEWALQKKAPFIKNKNSIADALIILSSAEYLKKKSIGITDSIFVSYNSKDFSSLKDKDMIHPDLQELLDEANMAFTRHIGKALKLSDEMLKEIDKYNEYIEYRIQDWIETQVDIARGK